MDDNVVEEKEEYKSIGLRGFDCKIYEQDGGEEV